MPTVSSRLIVPFSLLLFAALGGCVRASNAGSQKPAPEPTIPVRTAPVELRALPRAIALTGTLNANRESGVAADVSGKVAAVFVERGSRVAAGAPLVRLDRRAAALSEAEARSQAGAAASQRELARTECARADRLLDGGAINAAEHERLRAQCQATGFTAAAAEARRDLAGKTLRDLVVRAPFAGVVADRLITEGEYVRPDSRVATVMQLDPLRLELAVPEHAIGSFGAGTRVRFRVAAYPKEIFEGEVRFVGAAVRRASRDLLVEALVPNRDERLRPGMFAVADLVLGETSLPVVPRAAIRSDERAGTDRVFVVQGGRVEERLVHVGAAAGEARAVLSGLRAGERVVLNPAPQLRDGLHVQ